MRAVESTMAYARGRRLAAQCLGEFEVAARGGVDFEERAGADAGGRAQRRQLTFLRELDVEIGRAHV